MSEQSGFCTECGSKVESFEGLEACPDCGTKGVPCLDADQKNVSINWHELRILVMWAERWAHEQCGGAGVVWAIAGRLLEQHPDMGPLSLAGEVQNLKDHPPEGMGDIKTDVPGVE